MGSVLVLEGQIRPSSPWLEPNRVGFLMNLSYLAAIRDRMAAES